MKDDYDDGDASLDELEGDDDDDEERDDDFSSWS